MGTLMQKVVPFGDIAKYLDGTYTRIGGFVYRAVDVIILENYFDLYNGIRLDFKGSRYNPEKDYALGVIRFYTDSTDKLEIPYSKEMGGSTSGEFPFTGHGFASSTNGAIVPEYRLVDYVDMRDGAELYLVTKDGQEILLAVYKCTFRRFISIVN